MSKRMRKCSCGGRIVQSDQWNVNDFGQLYQPRARCEECGKRYERKEEPTQ